MRREYAAIGRHHRVPASQVARAGGAEARGRSQLGNSAVTGGVGGSLSERSERGLTLGVYPLAPPKVSREAFPADVSVFPNPTLNGKVRLHGMDIQTIHLCDNLGKMLTVNPTYFAENAFELDLSHYQKGIYYLGVTTGNSAMIWKKIVFN